MKNNRCQVEPAPPLPTFRDGLKVADQPNPTAIPIDLKLLAEFENDALEATIRLAPDTLAEPWNVPNVLDHFAKMIRHTLKDGACRVHGPHLGNLKALTITTTRGGE